MAWHILWVGLLMGLISLFAGYAYWNPADQDERYWRTIIFTVLTLSQMGHALATRSERYSLFAQGLLSNRAMLYSVLLTFVLQMALVYVPYLQNIFDTKALSAGDLLLCLVLSTIVFWAVETEKWIVRRGPLQTT